MIRIIVSLTLFVNCFSFYHTTSEDMIRGVPSMERRLYDYLLSGYDKTIRPVYNASHQVLVSFGVTLQRILHLDNKNQVLYANMWITLRWKDWRFCWDPLKFGNQTEVRISIDTIWAPDIMLYNKVDSSVAFRRVNAVLHSDGTVQWLPPVLTVSSCPLDIFFFPFDIELCSLYFASWAHDNSSLRLVVSSSSPDMSEYEEGGGEWSLVSMNNNDDSNLPKRLGVRVSLCIHRRPTFYWIHILAPCVSLNALCLATFWQTPNANGKVALSITTMLSHFVYVNVIAEKLPSSHNVPVIGIYLLVSLSMSIFAVVLSITSVNLFHRTTDIPPLQASTSRAQTPLSSSSSPAPLLHSFAEFLSIQRRSVTHHHRWQGLALHINKISFLICAAVMLTGYLLIAGMTLYVARTENAFCEKLLKDGTVIE